jgi:hypothetical protein
MSAVCRHGLCIKDPVKRKINNVLANPNPSREEIKDLKNHLNDPTLNLDERSEIQNIIQRHEKK